MRTTAWSLLGTLSLLPLVLVTPAAEAQDLGLWGGWNDGGHGWQGTKPRARDGSGSSSGGVFWDEYSSGGKFPALMDGGGRPYIAPEEPDIIAFPNEEAPGTILIDTGARRLYFTLSREEAYEYVISVGREGFTWTGTETVSRIAEWPDWHPPVEMRQRDPRLPEKMLGGIKNPLGAVALFLGNSLYRIHGTNDPKTIGIAASSGCFRMLNGNAVHLASIARVGTVVKVLPHLPNGEEVSDLPWLQKPAALGAGRDGG